MTSSATAVGLEPRLMPDAVPFPNEANASGVSWAAIAGGAFVAAALSVILLALGAGLGLSSVSPWSSVGASASAISAAGIIWLMSMQIISSAMGGYLAGRLRTKWANTHSDEVYFRDTAHGFLVWAVGLVITASFLTSSAASMAGGAAGSSEALGARGRTATAGETITLDPTAYFVDSLFRSEQQIPYDQPAHAEAARIFSAALRAKDMPAADRVYLAQMISARTGLNQTDADRRIVGILSDARQELDATRKATAHLLLWMFIAMLTGAFCASFAATIGGRQRDHVRALSI